MGVRATEGVGGSLIRKGLGAMAKGSEVTESRERILSGEWVEVGRGSTLVTTWRKCWSRRWEPR